MDKLGNVKDHIMSLITGVPFAVIAVIAIVLILHAIKKIRRKAVGAGLLIAGLCMLFPSAFMTIRQSDKFMTGMFSPKKSLSYAVAHLDAKAVKLLLDNGADPDAGAYSFFRGNYEDDDEDSTTPAEEAIQAHSAEKLKLLLDHGAKLKAEYLETALNNADVEAVKILLDRGADPDAKYQQTAETVREHIKKQYQSKIDQNRLSDAERQILAQLGIL